MSDDHDDESAESGRVTAPMQDYTMGEVGTGFLVLAVGLAVAFVLPALV